MKKLIPHKSNPASETEIKVEYKIEKDLLTVVFEVQTNIASNVSDSFSLEGFDNMGLWNFDVCELFVRKGSEGPYLELQVSPLSQKLALLIIEPRKVVEKVRPELTLMRSDITNTGFRSSISVRASDIPGEGEFFEGNFFCCLGAEDSRSYFAMNINNDKSADYHRPELFFRIY